MVILMVTNGAKSCSDSAKSVNSESYLSPFGGFPGPFRPKKNPKRTGMTRLGSPGASFQSVPGFARPCNPETDWDDTPGLPRLVIPVCFRVFPALFSQKTPKPSGGAFTHTSAPHSRPSERHTGRCAKALKWRCFQGLGEVGWWRGGCA